MKKLTTVFFASFVFLAMGTMTNCAQEDENALWLLALSGGGGGGGGEATGQGGPEMSPTPTESSESETPTAETEETLIDSVDEESTEETTSSEGEEGSEGTGAGSDAGEESAIDEEIAAEAEGTSGSDGSEEDAGSDEGSTDDDSTGAVAGDTTGTTDEGEDEFGDDLDDGEDLADGDADADNVDTDGTVDEDLADADNETDDSGASVEDSGEEAVACADRRIELDTSAGRWYETPAGNLPGVRPTKAQRNVIKAQIKSLRGEIKTLRASIKSGDIARVDGRNAIALLKKDITEERAKLGFGRKVKGVHTYWANQPLYLRVRNNCQAGWYKLKVVAKNIHGPLPDFYSHYNLSVYNETYDQALGGIHIKAEDDRYRRGRMMVYLEAGDTDLLLKWTNDAWKKGVYDANIQIKRVRLKYKKVRRNRRAMVRRAHQYCETKGRWFWDRNSARTYWANQRISFCFPDLESGKYKVRIVAKNYGSTGLPPGYENFIVDVAGDGGKGTASIKADDDRWRRGEVELDLTGGRTRIDLVWKNDKWKKGVYDANIQIKKIRLKRVGDSDRSALAAYLMANSSSTGLLTVLLGLLALAGLGGVHFWKRRQEQTA